MEPHRDPSAAPVSPPPGAPLGEVLRALREAAAMTQEDLAGAAGISVPTISALERGVHRSPQLHTAILLADALGLAGEDREGFLAAARRARPSRRSRPLAATPLPPAAGALVGRDRELADVEAMLDRARLTTITGPGGIGKTRLAREVARRMLDHRGAQVVAWISLAETDDPAGVLPAVARALGLRGAIEGDPAAAIGAAFSGRSASIVLDNLEHLPAAWPAIGALLDAAPGLRALVTSRSRLRLAGEQVLTLGPLPLPARDPAAAALRPAIEGAGGIGGVGGGLRRDDSIPDIARVVSLLDGMPLAIELAAAQSDAIPPAALAVLLEHAGLAALAAGPANGPDRHRRMDAAIAWSADLLAEPARELFALLGVFRGGFTVEALSAVAGALGRGDLVAMLPVLAGAPLVQPAAGDPARFGLLEPIRLFALSALRRDGGEQAARRAHAAWFTRHAARLAADIAGQQPVAALDAAEADLPNLLQAIAAASREGDHAVALAAAADLRRLWECRGYIAEGRAAAAAAISAALAATGPVGPPEAIVDALADACFLSGYLATLQCDFAAGSAEVDRLRTLAAGGRAGSARIGALADLIASGLAGDVAETASAAIDLLRHGLDLVAGDPDGFAAWALGLRLGVELFQQGDPAATVPLLRSAFLRVRLRGVLIDQPVCLVQLGLAEVALGDFAAAREHLGQGIDLGDRLGIEVAVLLGSLGLARAIVLAEDAAAYPEALRRLDAAEILRARAGYEYGAYWEEQIAECRRRIDSVRAAIGA
ncbi:MAG: ATP-binding protein [Chloroflexota bacterium]